MSHVRLDDGRTDDSTDLLIMASFLCIPIATLLWSIACFTIAVAAYCVQDTDRTGGALLLAVLGAVLVAGGVSTVLLSKRWKVRGNEGTRSEGVIGTQVGMSAVVNGPGNFAEGV